MSSYHAASSGDGQTMVAQAQEKVQETAQQATSAVGNAVREQVDTRAAALASELGQIGTAMRRSGHSLRAEGNESSAKTLDSVTERVEALGSYLERTDGDQLLRDVERFGRRQPWALVGAGMTLGFVASRFLKASSRSRYDQQAQVPYPPVARPAVPVAPAPPAPVTSPLAGSVAGSAVVR